MRIWLLFMLLAGPSLADGEMAEQLGIETAPVQRSLAKNCNFVSECYESEPCAETTFSADIEGRAGGLTPQDMTIEATMRSIGGDIDLLGLVSSGVFSLSGGPFEARNLLTISPSGDARYTIHIADGPQAITYIGTCE